MHWKTVYNSVHCYLLVFQNLHFTPPLPIGGGRFGMGAKPQGVWGTEVPQKLKNFLSSYKQILRIFGSISHISSIYAYVFSVFVGIIPLSLRNGGRHLIPFAPPPCLQVGGGGNYPLCPPAPPPMVSV